MADECNDFPAFPVVAGQMVYSTGLNLRDWFAGMALSNAYTHDADRPEQVARWAYCVADAMMDARAPTTDEATK